MIKKHRKQKASSSKSARPKKSSNNKLLPMNPAYIYFKEIDIDNDNNFTLNFAKDNEIENVVFNKNYEYAITSLKINAELPDNKIIKIEQTKKLEQKRYKK